MKLVFFILISSATPLFAINDSLFVIWQDKSQSDSVRGYAFKDFIYDHYFFSNPDSALIYYNQLGEFAKEKGLDRLDVDVHILSGYLFFRTGQYNEALEVYREGLDLAEQVNYELGAADILLRTGFVHHDNEDIIAALKYYQRSLDIYQKLDDHEGISSVYNEFGSIYRVKGDTERSLEYYQKSIEINDEIGDEKRNAPTFTNVGSLYMLEGDLDLALEYFRKAEEIFVSAEDELGIASVLSGIGNIFAKKKQAEESLSYLKRSLEISERINDTQGAVNTLLSIGWVYLDENQSRQARQYCSLSLDLSKQLGDIGSQMDACECLYIAHKNINKVEMALKYHEMMNLLRDSMQLEETAIQVQQMEFANQLLIDSLAQVEKEMQIRLAHQAEIQKKNMNRNIAIGVGLFFLLISIGMYRRWLYMRRSKAIIEREKERSENLLLNILPAEIAEELKAKGKAEARDYDLVSILFTDFKSFTEKASHLTAAELIEEINQCFKAFDFICEDLGIEKIKTIGDAYMAAGGLPVQSADSARRTIQAALKMQDFIRSRKDTKASGEVTFEMRVGINTGPVVAGIVGVKKFQYDVWGDTVNTASRMESNGEAGMVNISQATYELVKDDPQFKFTARGMVDVKGKGKVGMWFVSERDQ